eukprot:TRINITY_DN23508_c0_g1_i1.p1 TRINITY_DN23508_c0_g1~~TRINITY_DN23508_c0_g1_i1.p1  ORF type:complete len:249 (+),score=59.22 TRINITY_DN23508_c0_g1_i1:389-1135(+)
MGAQDMTSDTRTGVQEESPLTSFPPVLGLRDERLSHQFQEAGANTCTAEEFETTREHTDKEAWEERGSDTAAGQEGDAGWFSRVHETEESAFTSEELEELILTFKEFDMNGDGRISISEVESVLRQLGEDLSQSDLEAMVHCADMDGDGCIDLEEFLQLHERVMCRNATGPQTKELEAMFRMFDKDGNGLICAEELLAVMRSVEGEAITLDDCDEMIRTADMNGDGHVDFEEFGRLMRADFSRPLMCR